MMWKKLAHVIYFCSPPASYLEVRTYVDHAYDAINILTCVMLAIVSLNTEYRDKLRILCFTPVTLIWTHIKDLHLGQMGLW